MPKTEPKIQPQPPKVKKKIVSTVKTKGIYLRGKIYWICYAGADGKTIRESTKQTLKGVAILILADRVNSVKEQKKQPNHIIPEIISFKKFADKYKKHCEHQKGYSQKKLVINQLVTYFGNYDVTEISLRILEEYATYRRSVKKNAEATINRHIATFKNMATKMYDWKYIPDTQLNELRRIKLLDEEGERKMFLTEQQVPLLLEACKKQPHLYDIVQFAIHTGCRRGEILKLRWDENVNLDTRYIMLRVTKSARSREIPIDTTVYDMLKRRQKLNPKNPYVFFDQRKGKDTGKLNSIKSSFETARDKAGFPWLHFHDLRHTFASHLVMKTVDLTTVKELLGHQSMAMTSRYAHLTDEHKKLAVGLLDDVFNPAPKTVAEPAPEPEMETI